MKIGVPKEVKNHEYRVAITPIGVHELTAHGHEVHVQAGAGLGSSINDEEYVAAGATIVPDAEPRGAPTAVSTWCSRSRSRSPRSTTGCARALTLFTYLHLAADKPLTEELLARKVTGDRLRDRAAALGRAAAALPDVGGRRLPRAPGRRLQRCSRPRAAAACSWAGWAASPTPRSSSSAPACPGQNAANIALGMGADVTLLDTDLDKLRMSFWRYNNRVHGLASSKLAIQQHVMEADMVIGAVLIPGAAAPKLVSNDLVVGDEAGLGARRHRRRPGRLLRGHPRHDPRRPDLPGARLDVLLRGQHAGRRARTPRPTR